MQFHVHYILSQIYVVPIQNVLIMTKHMMMMRIIWRIPVKMDQNQEENRDEEELHLRVSSCWN